MSTITFTTAGLSVANSTSSKKTTPESIAIEAGTALDYNFTSIAIHIS